MVKVKALRIFSMTYARKSFNHPMVKVKAENFKVLNFFTAFQPPYGES